MAVVVGGCSLNEPKPATQVTDVSAKLNGSVSSNEGGQVTYWFRYGTTTDYGNVTPDRTVQFPPGHNSNGPRIPVSETITGLEPNTTYHYQGCASPGIEAGSRACTPQDLTFTTGSPGGIERVNLRPDGSQLTGAVTSAGTGVSGDGNEVVYYSGSNQIVPGDTNNAGDVFVRDRAAGVNERVSVTSEGVQGNGDSLNAEISSDGRYVVFGSDASNLVPDDDNGARDTFIHDRQTDTTELVGVGDDEERPDAFTVPSDISPDGRYVIFGSSTDGLVAGDDNGIFDVFLRDRQAGTTERVSVNSAEVGGNSFSDGGAVSADGRYVAFRSFATNLSPGDHQQFEIYLRDRQSGTTERVSFNVAGNPPNLRSAFPEISGDGRFVAFISDASDLVEGDDNGTWDVFVRDMTLDETDLISAGHDSPVGDGQSFTLPEISADGRWVAFGSEATNLVPSDTNDLDDVFLRDRESDTTERMSVNSAGEEGNGRSLFPILSPDGRWLVFYSEASNLPSADTNGAVDVFWRFGAPAG